MRKRRPVSRRATAPRTKRIGAMKTSKRWSYLNDYKKTAGGEYVYTGSVYHLAGNGARDRRLLAALSFLSAAVAVGSGCINAAGLSNTFYVILPYIGEIAAVFVLCWQTVKLLAAGQRVKTYVRDSLEKYLPPAALALIIFSAASLIASPVFLIQNGTEGKPFQCALYLVLKAVGLVLGLFARRHIRAISWEERQ